MYITPAGKSSLVHFTKNNRLCARETRMDRGAAGLLFFRQGERTRRAVLRRYATTTTRTLRKFARARAHEKSRLIRDL